MMKTSEQLQQLQQQDPKVFPNWKPNWWPLLSPHLTNSSPETSLEDVGELSELVRLRSNSEELWKNKSFRTSFNKNLMKRQLKLPPERNYGSFELVDLESIDLTGQTPDGSTSTTPDDPPGKTGWITWLTDWSVIGESLDQISIGLQNISVNAEKHSQQINSWHSCLIGPNVSLGNDKDDE